MKKTDISKTIIDMVFPKELLESFDVVEIKEYGTIDEPEVSFVLEEKDVYKGAEEGHKYEKNGFYESCTISDFPLRDRKVSLEIKRRRWIDTTTGKSVGNSYELSAKGTRHSVEFAAFLKEVFGYIPNCGVFA